MKKVPNILLSVTVTVMVWVVIRAIWRSTVQFADIFGDTGGEDMALVIGVMWLGLPVLSFARLFPKVGMPTATWATTMLLAVPFFIIGFLTRSMPIHELAVDAAHGQHHYLTHVVPYQSLLWVTAMLPWLPIGRWLWQQFNYNQPSA